MDCGLREQRRKLTPLGIYRTMELWQAANWKRLQIRMETQALPLKPSACAMSGMIRLVFDAGAVVTEVCISIPKATGCRTPSHWNASNGW